VRRKDGKYLQSGRVANRQKKLAAAYYAPQSGSIRSPGQPSSLHLQTVSLHLCRATSDAFGYGAIVRVQAAFIAHKRGLIRPSLIAPCPPEGVKSSSREEVLRESELGFLPSPEELFYGRADAAFAAAGHNNGGCMTASIRWVQKTLLFRLVNEQRGLFDVHVDGSKASVPPSISFVSLVRCRWFNSMFSVGFLIGTILLAILTILFSPFLGAFVSFCEYEGPRGAIRANYTTAYPLSSLFISFVALLFP
jgi:hypothetical protein